jgi:tetratricopeptide (TPR) repeat protein
VALGLSLLAARPARGESAERLFAQAVAEFREARFEKSIALLEQAERASPEQKLHPQIQLFLGVNLAVLGRSEQAKEAFSRALGLDPALTLDPTQFKREIIELLEQVRAKLRSTLGVSSEVAEAEVLVDGKLRGRVPLEVDLPVGRHTVTVRASHGRAWSQAVVLLAGRRTEIAVRLGPVSTAATRPRPTALERTLPDTSREDAQLARTRGQKSILGYTALGVGMACAAAMATLYAVGYVQRKNAYEDYAKLPAGTSAETFEAKWNDVTGAQNKITAGHVLAGAAALTLGFSIYELLTRPEAPSRRRAKLVLTVGGTAAHPAALVFLGNTF